MPSTANLQEPAALDRESPEEVKPTVESIKLDTYARILVEHAVALRPGQDLYVRGPQILHDMALRIGAAGYECGARAVHYHLPDPDQLEQLIRYGRPEQVMLHQEEDRTFYSQILRTGDALIVLAHSFEPSPWMQRAVHSNPSNYDAFVHGISEIDTWLRQSFRTRLFPHTVAPCATPDWGRRLFPDLSQAEAMARLWNCIFRITSADQRDPLELLAEQDRRHKARTKALNQLQITEMHLFGKGTDLRIGLSEKARWFGGSLKSTNGQAFYPNFPSEEIFTTPNCHLTQGHLVASRPFRLFNCCLIESLVMDFEDGRVVGFEADQGREEFARWIDRDAGARFLGEIGLVGQNSTVAQTGLYFDFPQFDENAASHIALGQAHTVALEGGEMITEKELIQLGFNRSAIHTDIMFGSPAVTIVASKSKEGELTLLDRGHWTNVSRRKGPRASRAATNSDLPTS